MSPHIDVTFEQLPHAPSVEASVQRWVERLCWSGAPIDRARVTIECAGWGRTSVCLTLVLDGGATLTTTMSHADVYVAVANVFRDARKVVIGGAAAPAGRAHASA